MLYESTRGMAMPVSSAVAIKLGIAPDGGLFVPEKVEKISKEELVEMAAMTYNQRALRILEIFLTDFSTGELKDCVDGAYNQEKFDTPAIAPVHKLAEGFYILELWHGPTCAFKDMALQILPQFLPRAAARTGETCELAILVATSGDTGKAALEGFKNVPGTKIIVFYPEKGVSEVQKLQMVTQEGDNVHVIAVQGNFDQAQSAVKEIFTDKAINQVAEHYRYRFSSANSINWGRLVPQIAYYFSAYLDLLATGELTVGEKINFVVPTGNFGNILAAFYAREMGLPVHRLILAANQNNVLTDFIRSGVYNRKRPFFKTISPSMDILISSNLERLLYEITGHDTERVRNWMITLKEEGHYTVDDQTHTKISSLFWSDFAGEDETMTTIRNTYQEYAYLLDTHTAVGKYVYDAYLKATGDNHKTVIASTASPFKFNHSVVRAIWGEEAVGGQNEFELLEFLARKTGLTIPAGLQNIEKKPVLHTTSVRPEEMKKIVIEILSQYSPDS